MVSLDAGRSWFRYHHLFGDLRVEGTATVLTGPLADQAALHGALAQIEALGLELLDVHRLEPEPGAAQSPQSCDGSSHGPGPYCR